MRQMSWSYIFSFYLLIWYILIIPSWNKTNFFIIHFSCLNYAWLDLVFWYYSGFFFPTYVQESYWSVILPSCYFFFFGNWGYASFTELVGSILLFTLPEKFDNIRMIYSLKKLRTLLQRGSVFVSTEAGALPQGAQGLVQSFSGCIQSALWSQGSPIFQFVYCS